MSLVGMPCLVPYEELPEEEKEYDQKTLKEEVKQLLWNIAFVSEQLAIQTFSKNLEHIRVLVADICTSKYEGYYLASVIARKVELKPKSVISIFSIMEQFDYIFYYFALQGFHIPLFSSK